MPAYVSRPEIVLAPHKITTDDVLDDIRTHHADHPRLPAVLRVVQGCGVSARYFARSLEETAAPVGVEVRSRRAFRDALAMAVPAAQRAMAAADLTPGDVDCLVTSHTTGWAVPQLDVHLVGALGLRPTVSRIPLATLACAGSAHALIRAADYVRAHPGARVLVVVAEVPSTIYHYEDTTIEHMIYRALFGDSGGACIVTSEPLGPGLRIDGTLECVLPDSLDRYWGRLDAAGMHFDSTRKAATAAGDAIPYLQEWMGDRRSQWAVIHPGGPRIITDVAAGLGLTDDDAQHSTDSLDENGNLGGVAALDVLARTHTAPPAAGTDGVMAAFGPGFTVSALRGAWHA